MSTWIDNHCHIPPGADGDEWVAGARAAGVEKMVTVGVTVDRSREAIQIARRHENVFATVGVHPHDAAGGIDGLAELIDESGVVAIGEAGLDYFYDHSPRDEQKRVFARQLELANLHDMPFVIHTRDAWEDTFDILDDVGVPRRTVFHCFTGGPAEAEAGLERGIVISISGIVTFENAKELQEAVRICPLDSVMVETDSPYLAPVPHRGKPNRPANVVHVGHAVAGILGCDIEEVAATTTATANRFYDLT